MTRHRKERAGYALLLPFVLIPVLGAAAVAAGDEQPAKVAADHAATMKKGKRVSSAR